MAMTAPLNTIVADAANQSWLDCYLTRIGSAQDCDICDRDGVAGLMRAHIETFPFDMLDFFLGTSPTINLDAITRKFLVDRRGGGCSQQNALLEAVLRALGVVSNFGMARVPREDGSLGPRGHMVLFTELDGQTWLCDAGYGVGGPLEPLLIEPGLIQHHGCHQFQIVPAQGEFYELRRFSQGLWKPLYLFDRRTYDLEDFEPANYFNSLSPRSIFTRNLIVSRPTLGGGILILNNSLVLIEEGNLSKRRIQSAEELSEHLLDHFSITLTKSNFIRLPPAYGTGSR